VTCSARSKTIRGHRRDVLSAIQCAIPLPSLLPSRPSIHMKFGHPFDHAGNNLARHIEMRATRLASPKTNCPTAPCDGKCACRSTQGGTIMAPDAADSDARQTGIHMQKNRVDQASRWHCRRNRLERPFAGKIRQSSTANNPPPQKSANRTLAVSRKLKRA
jgi:hypothetical protein